MNENVCENALDAKHIINYEKLLFVMARLAEGTRLAEWLGWLGGGAGEAERSGWGRAAWLSGKPSPARRPGRENSLGRKKPT